MPTLMPSAVAQVLQDCSVVLGLHPDGALGVSIPEPQHVQAGLEERLLDCFPLALEEAPVANES